MGSFKGLNLGLDSGAFPPVTSACALMGRWTTASRYAAAGGLDGTVFCYWKRGFLRCCSSRSSLTESCDPNRPAKPEIKPVGKAADGVCP